MNGDIQFLKSQAAIVIETKESNSLSPTTVITHDDPEGTRGDLGHQMNSHPAFCGLEPRTFKWDRLYRIYVTPDCLCGAYVAGQFYDEQSARSQLQSFYLFLRGWVRRWLQRRQDREARYDAMEDPSSLEFLAADSHNFQIGRNQIIKVTVNRKRSRRVRHNVGTVDIELGDGSRRRLILVGDQTVDAITEALGGFYPDTEVVGEPSPVPTEEERRRSNRNAYAVISFGFFGYAVWFAVRGLFAVLRAQLIGYFYILFGALNVLVAVYCIRRARSFRTLPEDRTNGV